MLTSDDHMSDISVITFNVTLATITESYFQWHPSLFHCLVVTSLIRWSDLLIMYTQQIGPTVSQRVPQGRASLKAVQRGSVLRAPLAR